MLTGALFRATRWEKRWIGGTIFYCSWDIKSKYLLDYKNQGLSWLLNIHHTLNIKIIPQTFHRKDCGLFWSLNVFILRLEFWWLESNPKSFGDLVNFLGSMVLRGAINPKKNLWALCFSASKAFSHSFVDALKSFSLTQFYDIKSITFDPLRIMVHLKQYIYQYMIVFSVLPYFLLLSIFHNIHTFFVIALLVLIPMDVCEIYAS